MFQVKAKITKNVCIREKYHKIILEQKGIVKTALPGQFVTVKVSDAGQPLLRRPLGIHQTRGKKFELLYEVIGEGTKILAQRKAGEYLDIIGPLGSGFGLGTAQKKPHPILVAGGMGVAPLLFLAKKMGKAESLVLIGAKNKKQVLCEKEFKALGCEVKIATDDGSAGFKGKVTGLLIKLLSTACPELVEGRSRGVNCELSTIYACGPRPMLVEISKISREYNIPAQVSLEAHMACGIGACLGCAVKVKDNAPLPKGTSAKMIAECATCCGGWQSAPLLGDFSYKRVCKDGPVFDAAKIIWE